MITYEIVKKDAEVNTLIQKADELLTAIGYTEHCFAHVEKVAVTAYRIMKDLGFSERDSENARIAGYLHDIGNVVNRYDHAQSGALLAYPILKRLGADAADTADIVTAIGNHDEHTGVPVNPVAAALIIADKSDVRAARVRNVENVSGAPAFDIHDRVNYAVQTSRVTVDKQKRIIELDITIDINECPVMDYFEIYVGRMTLCRKAAAVLGANFSLVINGSKLV